jgi:hypothetical protein
MSDLAVSLPRPSTTVDAARGDLLHLDPVTFAEALGRRECAVRHSLASHPLLQLEAIAQLADAMPKGTVELHEAKQPLLVPGGLPDIAAAPGSTVRSIATNQRWMVLWNIEQVPAYRALLDQILDQAEPYLPKREGPMGRREAFLFLSAPNAVTPVHFDPEHNFLLQIRGWKEMNVGRFPDRASEMRELDRYHDGGHRNLEAIPPLSTRFNMRPGEGVYVYPWAPHWVNNGPEASMSLSITFRTQRSQRQERVHVLNARLRRHGLKPRPAGDSEGVDWSKGAFLATASWLKRGGRRQRGARDYS